MILDDENVHLSMKQGIPSLRGEIFIEATKAYNALYQQYNHRVIVVGYPLNKENLNGRVGSIH